MDQASDSFFFISIVEAEGQFLGTIEVHLDSSKISKLSISEDIAVRLAALARTLEKMFGSPRDIEFAIEQVQK